jgi:hypothetical protein
MTMITKGLSVSMPGSPTLRSQRSRRDDEFSVTPGNAAARTESPLQASLQAHRHLDDIKRFVGNTMEEYMWKVDRHLDAWDEAIKELKDRMDMQSLTAEATLAQRERWEEEASTTLRDQGQHLEKLCVRADTFQELHQDHSKKIGKQLPQHIDKRICEVQGLVETTVAGQAQSLEELRKDLGVGFLGMNQLRTEHTQAMKNMNDHSQTMENQLQAH